MKKDNISRYLKLENKIAKYNKAIDKHQEKIFKLLDSIDSSLLKQRELNDVMPEKEKNKIDKVLRKKHK